MEASTHYHYQQGDQVARVERGTEQAPDGGLSTYKYDYDDRGRLVEVIKDGVIVVVVN